MRVMKLNERLTKVRCANDKLRGQDIDSIYESKEWDARKTSKLVRKLILKPLTISLNKSNL